ncbi:MAG: ACP S-malonyltransferase [Vicinamibacterales bacterium]
MKAAFVFPGQGSQSVAMLKDYADHSVIRETLGEASEALGQDLWSLIENGPDEALSQTVNTQPVMLAADIAVYRAWLQEGGCTPVVAAGHSLGEYAALVAAGSLSLPDAVRVVRQRAEAMQAAVPEGVGAIAAVLGLDEDAVRQACREAAEGEVVTPANINAPGQIVISGHAGAVGRAIELCKQKGAKRAVLLPMSIPAHCPLMAPATSVLDQALSRAELKVGSFPVVHNVDVSVSETEAALHQALLRQLYNPVRWVETVRMFEDFFHVTHVVECGPGKVLHGLVRRIVTNSACHTLSSSQAIRETVAISRQEA